jgi:cytochrome c553
MLLRDERSCQGHCLDGRRSVSVVGSARGGNSDVAAADKRRSQNRPCAPTQIAWTSSTLEQIAAGNAERGAAACHSQLGVSSSSPIPTLAGMDAAVIFKQLDDYRSGKRPWGVMAALAKALSAQDSADVAIILPPRRAGCRR